MNVVGSETEGYTLTVIDANGQSQTVKIPSAASLITSIVLKDEPNPQRFIVTKAVFTKPAEWYGKKTLPSDQSCIYSSSNLDVRINPVDAPATEVKYYLTNTNNKTLSNIALSAEASEIGNGLTIGNISGRAAVSGNGLYTLSMDDYILSESAAAAFDKELSDNGALSKAAVDANTVDITTAKAYAVNANNAARSAYNVAILTTNAAPLSAIQIGNDGTSKADLTNTIDKAKATVNVGQTYTIVESGSENAGLLFDSYFYISEKDQKTFGVVCDDLNRTFTVKNNPDVSTAANGFTLYVYTLDTKGRTDVVEYTIKLSSKIDVSSTYEPVTYNISTLYDTNDYNDNFDIDMDIMKNDLGDQWTLWANNVDLAKTSVVVYSDAKCESEVLGVTTSSTNDGLSYCLSDEYGSSADESTLKYTTINVSKITSSTPLLKLDKQYYLKITFNTSASTAINSIVVPVTFTAPSVAEQFTPKVGYVVNNVIEAYYYEPNSKKLVLNRYFDNADASALLTFTDDKVLESVAGTDYKASGLANLAKATDATVMTIAGTISLKESVGKNDGTKRELGYGDVFTIKAANAYYKDSKWAYTTDSKKSHTFDIKIMSPIYEGSITPATGTSIKVIANSEAGFDITADMISAKDYTGVTTYNIMPDKEGTEDEPFAWSSAQIERVAVAKKGGNNNTYIKTVGFTAYTPAKGDAPAKLGTINVKAEPLPNDTPSAIIVSVTDAWGYISAQEVPVTIATK